MEGLTRARAAHARAIAIAIAMTLATASALSAITASASTSGQAHAGESPLSEARGASAMTSDDAAQALFLSGQMDERAFAFERALGHYRASFAASPSSRYAPRAMNRVRELEAHSEGGFLPLARLEQIRQDPQRANDPQELARLARDAIDFPPGLVRVEAWMLAGEAYAGRLNRHADAIPLFRRVTADPKADPLTRRQAARALVDTLVGDGQIDAAREDAHALAAYLAPSFVLHVDRLVRRRTIGRIAEANLALIFVAAAAAVGAATWRGRGAAVIGAMRQWAPIAGGYVAYIAIAGGVLASNYEAGNAKPFLAFGAAIFPLAMAARAWGVAAPSEPNATRDRRVRRSWRSRARWGVPRLARASVCAMGALATAFLVLAWVDPIYLEGFGL